MKVYISLNDESKKYHLPECPIAQEMKYPYRRKITPGTAVEEGYCHCDFCGGLKGYFRVYEAQTASFAKENGLGIEFDDRTNTLYVRTKVGFWKVFEQKRTGMYILLHLNEYKSTMSNSELRNGAFHRQSDMKPTYSLGRLLNYIAEHDRAAEIMAVDYTKLPRTTYKERKYYRRAEERSKHTNYRRIERLFDLIETENPGLREVQSVLLD